MQVLRLGTRTSKLAMIQVKLVQAALQTKFPELAIDIIPINTQADQTDIPLGDLPGNAFCTAFDQALLENKIDAAVHSRKDRTSVPPSGIVIAALMSRANPRDVVLFRKDITDVLHSGRPLILGVCARHRETNIPPFLKKALPQFGKEIRIETKQIRGMIDKRLEKIGSEYDGIVLAAAGLSRLYPKTVLSDFLYMVLPLSECPAAPGQGALEIDCRKNDEETKEILAALHDPVTAKHVAREFDALFQYGNDIGATSINAKNVSGHLLFVKGENISFINWPQAEVPPIEGPYWDGAANRSQNDNSHLPIRQNDISAKAVFIAHSRAVPPLLIETLKNKTLWTSGIHSWFRLAQQGLWIQGCTEELGHSVLTETIDTAGFLGLPAFSEWQVMTHDRSANDWAKAQILATYKAYTAFDPRAAEEIETAKHIFWSSATQYTLYKDYVPNKCHHYCRAGKTADTLISYNVTPLTIFPNHEMWRQCLKTA